MYGDEREVASPSISPFWLLIKPGGLKNLLCLLPDKGTKSKEVTWLNSWSGLVVEIGELKFPKTSIVSSPPSQGAENYNLEGFSGWLLIFVKFHLQNSHALLMTYHLWMLSGYSLKDE